MSADAVAPPERSGAWETFVRGVRLSPVLRSGLGGTVVLALLATGGRAIIPIVVQQTIDRGVIGDGTSVDLDLVTQLTFVAFGAVLLTAIASGWMNSRLAKVTETALSDLRVDTFAHVHDLSMLHQAAEQRGAMVSRVTSDVDQISQFMQWGGIGLIQALGQLVISVAVMLVYSVPLTVIVVVTFVIYIAVARRFQRLLDHAFEAVRVRVGAMLAAVGEVVVGASVIRAYGIEARSQARLDDTIEDHRSSAVHAGKMSAIFSGLSETFSGGATVAVIAAGLVWGVGSGNPSPGTLIAFLFLIRLFVEPLTMAGEIINDAQTAVAGWRRVLDVLDIEPDVADPGPDGVTIPDGPIDVRFAGVGFRYPKPGEPARQATGFQALVDVDVHLPERTNIAVVGETGSGKTTFAKLLTRLMDPTSGKVLLSGVPIDSIRFDDLRNRVVMVPQEGALFGGSIRENVAMGSEDVDDDGIRLAFVELGLGDWLEDLRDGLDTDVGERGTSMSAGERQLVTLARAYVADPDLLVLDEATSSVDPLTEVRLQRALSGLTIGRTTVSIAHRLSTAENADLVLVFDGGKLVGRGHHDELRANNDVYARLHDSWVAGTATR